MTTAQQESVAEVLKRLPHYDHEHFNWADEPGYYDVPAEVVRDIRPKSVVEIGTLLGYSLATMLLAAPGITRVTWVDNEQYLSGSNDLASKNLDWLRTTMRLKFEWSWCREIRPHMTALAGPDLVHIDGDHTYGGKMRDLVVAFDFLRPKVVLVDDVETITSVREAVRDYARGTGRTYRVYPSSRGLARFDLE